MVLSISKTYYNALLQMLVVIYFSNLSTNKDIIYTQSPDFYKRVICNDSSINLLYYFWTNFDWLLYFMCIMYVFIVLKSNQNKNHLILMTAIVFYIYFEYHYLYSYSYFFTKNLNINPDYFNNLLSNDINKYHPLLFYISTFMLLNTDRLSNISNSTINFHNIKYKHRSLINTLLITTTLFMGSWWALQEGSWGGWWNWDASEMLGLLIMTLIYINLHTSFSTYYLYKLTYITYIYLIFIYYILIQSNFNIVSHNFGSLGNDVVNLDYWYIIFILYSSIVINRHLNNINYGILKFINTYKVNTITFINPLINILVILSLYILLISSLPIISSITLFLTYTNTNNFYFDITYLLIPTMYIMTYFLVKTYNYYFIIHLILIFNYPQYLVILLITSAITKLNNILLHFLISSIIIISVSWLNTDLWIWSLENTYNYSNIDIQISTSNLNIHTIKNTLDHVSHTASNFISNTSASFDCIYTPVSTGFIYESINPSFLLNTFSIYTLQLSTNLIFNLFILSYITSIIIYTKDILIRF